MPNTLHIIINLQEIINDNNNHQDNNEFGKAFHARSLGLLGRSWKKDFNLASDKRRREQD